MRWFILLLVAGTTAVSHAVTMVPSLGITMSEYIEREWRRGAPPRIEELRPGETWTCLETDDINDTLHFGQRLVLATFQPESEGVATASFPIGYREGEFFRVKRPSQAAVRIGAGGGLIAKTKERRQGGETWRYLCGPGDLLQLAAKTRTAPKAESFTVMAQRFAAARKPAARELRLGRPWPCTTRGRTVEVYYDLGKRWERSHAPDGASLSLVPLGGLILVYTGRSDGRLLHNWDGGMRDEEHSAQLYDRGLSFLVGSWPKTGDLELAWSDYRIVAGVYETASARLRIDPKSGELLIRYGWEDVYTYKAYPGQRMSIEGYAVCGDGG